MSEEEHIDFKKEFEEFKKELENSNPLFDDESIEFNDFDNLIFDSKNNENHDDLEEIANPNNNYPMISLETEDILMNLTIKKDYSTIDDLHIRKKEFINDLKELIDEFASAEESIELMKYYNK